MTVTTEQIQGLTGKVYAQNSEKVGGIGQIYLDDTTGAPSWVTVKTGLFGSAETFVPLQSGRVDGEDVYVDFDEDTIKNAPRVEPDGSISPDEEDRLYDYYGLSDNGGVDDTGTSAGRTVAGDQRDSTEDRSVSAAGDASGVGDARTDVDDQPVSADRSDVDNQTVAADRSESTTDEAMTRSEERLTVGTASREAGRARLRKYVTSETVTETVPVRHEEVTLEREPITDANYDAAQSGPSISEEEHEVVLHEEVPTVEKDVVPVERVKLAKETVTEDATVTEEVRQENIETVDPDTRTR